MTKTVANTTQMTTWLIWKNVTTTCHAWLIRVAFVTHKINGSCACPAGGGRHKQDCRAVSFRVLGSANQYRHLIQKSVLTGAHVRERVRRACGLLSLPARGKFALRSRGPSKSLMHSANT